MTTAARTRRHHWHAPEKGTGPAFVISLAAHALLFLAIAFVVRWKTEPAGPVSAELWSGLPPVVEPAPPPPPPPPPKIERIPEPQPQKAEIVIEQKKPEPKPEPKPEKKAEPVKKVEPVKKAEPPKPDPKVELKKRQEAEARAAAKAAEARREQEMMRIAAAAGGAPAGAVAAGGVGFSRSYEGQVIGCIRPHIVFSVPDTLLPKQHVAEFNVLLLPTGEQAGAPKLLKSSGLPAFDQAVERAIRRCDPFPRPKEGAMPRDLKLTFDPVDTR